MPYVLNILVLGGVPCGRIERGRLIADPDEPCAATLRIDGRVFEGARSLLVVDEGKGYLSGWTLVEVPADPDAPAFLRVPPDGMGDLEALLEALLRRSPGAGALIYLEANRHISRSQPDDPHPPSPVLREGVSLSAFLRIVREHGVREEEIFPVTIVE